MELICQISSATNPGPPEKGRLPARASCTLVSVGSSEAHRKAVGENGHVRIDIAGEGPILGGALAGELKGGEEYEVIIRKRKKATPATPAEKGK